LFLHTAAFILVIISIKFPFCNPCWNMVYLRLEQSDRKEQRKDLTELPRHSVHALKDRKRHIILVRWQDSSQIIMATDIQNCNISLTFDHCQHWRGTEKKSVSIQKPPFICQCSNCMDMLIYLTRIVGYVGFAAHLESSTGLFSNFVTVAHHVVETVHQVCHLRNYFIELLWQPLLHLLFLSQEQKNQERNE
jgi:hypothetical protein